MIDRISFVAALLCFGTSAITAKAPAPTRPLTEISHVDSVGSAYTTDGKIKIDLREVRTEIMGVKGPKALSVLVMFEPKSGAYSWRAFDADPTDPSWRSKQLHDEQAVFLKDSELTHFMALSGPPRLFVHRYRGHASNMNDAVVKALKSASESIDPLGDMEKGQGVHVISLLSLGRDFTIDSTSLSAAPFSVNPKVTDVQWDGKYWTVTLQARWKAVITLDADYALVSMRKVE
jgi:hypothetical protein